MRKSGHLFQPGLAVLTSPRNPLTESLLAPLIVRVLPRKITKSITDMLFTGRNDEFLKATKEHAEWVFSNAIIINATPSFFRPMIGNLIWLYGRRVRRQCLKPMLPLIQERLSLFWQQQREPSDHWSSPVSGGFKGSGVCLLTTRPERRSTVADRRST
jgi:hypothetical protein